MGTSRQFRVQFLSKNSLCCFCGGVKDATTIDHIPPRTLFRDRKWPEGFIFPACQRCNDLTRKDELLVGMLGRIFPDADTAEHKAQVTDLMAAVHRNFPGLMDSMRISAAKKKRLLDERGIAIPQGQTAADVGLMSMEDPRFEEAVHRFGTKMMLALFYHHTGKVLPPAGGIPFRWFSNAQNLDEMLPKDLLAPLLSGFAELKRENTSLKDQFFYRYAVADTKVAAAFFVFFNQSLAMLGFVFSDISKVKVPENAIVLRPFSSLAPDREMED